MNRRVAGVSFAAALALGGLAACGEDEDGDGGTTDEEIQEGENRVNDVGDEVESEAENMRDEVEQEIDAQDKGSNQDGE